MVAISARNSLDVNHAVGDTFFLSGNGSDWLWAVTAVYAFSLLVVVGLSYFAKGGERIFHYLFTISLFVGSISYFTMASGLGSIPVATADGAAGTREIFYARYINWFVGWTPLVIAVSLISGVSWATIGYNIGLTWTWVASWLAGALVSTTYKWGFFTFGLFAEILLWVSLLHRGQEGARRFGIFNHYIAITGWLVLLWLLYPVAFGVDDGGNTIKVTSGFIFFGILDILTVPLLAYVFLLLSPRWDYGAMNLYFTQYGRVPQGGVMPEREKAPAPVAAPAVPAGEQAA